MQPRYSVLLPTRNGGKYLRECVESVLGQRLGDLELIVLDDASTDGSIEWLRSLPDSRVQIHPSGPLPSIQANWARFLEVPKNEFMTIIGQDDVLDPDFLQVIDRLIRRVPDARLYQTRFRLIDADGRLLRSCRRIPERESGAEFLAARLTDRRDSFATGYVMRSATYQDLGGIPLYNGLIFADDALWLMLMRDSWKAAAPEECFSYRRHAASAARLVEWNVILDAADRYTQFLAELAAEDPAVGKLLRRYGGSWFGRCLLGIFISAHLKAFRQDATVSPELLARCSSILTRVSPEAGGRFKKSHLIRGLRQLDRLGVRKVVGCACEPLWRSLLTARVR
jgi:glycosyltransferase involved in cell wall biosynthesis